MKQVSLQVSGRVQGVWFRAETKRRADDLGVFGSVRNMVNGNVYIEACGSIQKIDQFIEWCKKGPPLARVNHIEIKIIELIAKEFIIIR